MVVSYESVISSLIGEFGWSQLLIVGTVKFMNLVVGWSMVMTGLITTEPMWWTEVEMSPLNTTTNATTINTTTTSTLRHQKTCPSSLNTSGPIMYVFDASVNTIVGEWNLVCDMSWVPGVITTTQMVGVMVGASVVGQLSDWYGRRRSTLCAYLCVLLSVLLQGFSSSWYMLCTFSFTLGFGLGGFLVCSQVFFLEYVGTRWRTFIAAVIPSWAVGIILLGVAFKWVPNWRYLCYTNVVLGCLPLITFWFCPESLRWLLTQGRIEDAKHTLTILTRRNKRPPPDFAALDTLTSLTAKKSTGGETMIKYNYITLLANKYARWRVLVFGFLWFAMAFGYYAITFGVGTLNGDVSINMMLNGVVEVLSQWAVIPISRLLGRRMSTFSSIFLTSVSLFGVTAVYAATDDEETISTTQIALALSAKFFISAAWTNVILFSMETFPTVIRNTAYGLASVCGRIGGVVAPQNKTLLRISPHLPFTLNGGVQFVSAMLCLLLSDTYSSHLPDHFQDGRGGGGGECDKGNELSCQLMDEEERNI